MNESSEQLVQQQVLIQLVCLTGVSAFLTSSQVVVMLVVPGPHFQLGGLAPNVSTGYVPLQRSVQLL